MVIMMMIKAGSIFPEIMQNFLKIKVIKHGTEALDHSKMVVILNCLALIWCSHGLHNTCIE